VLKDLYALFVGLVVNRTNNYSIASTRRHRVADHLQNIGSCFKLKLNGLARREIFRDSFQRIGNHLNGVLGFNSDFLPLLPSCPLCTLSRHDSFSIIVLLLQLRLMGDGRPDIFTWPC